MQEQQKELEELLAQHQEDELETTKYLLRNIGEAQDQPIGKYIAMLNTLLNNKALPSRQRRDVAGIARLVADAAIYAKIADVIRKEILMDESHWGVYLATIKLVTQICWENPHLIETINIDHPQIIDLLLALLADPLTTPTKDESHPAILNFLHSISLKEGAVRTIKMAPTLTTFISNILTHPNFYSCLQSRRINALYSSLNKFHSNVKEIDKPVFNALQRSLYALNKEYRALGVQFKESKGEGYKDIRARTNILDKRLVAVLKLQQKSRGGILSKIDPFNFLPTLKLLSTLTVHEPLLLIDSPYENKILITSIEELISDITEWRDHLTTLFDEVEEQEMKPEGEMISEPKNDSVLEQKEGQQKQQGQNIELKELNPEYFKQKIDSIKKFNKLKKYFQIFPDTLSRMVDQVTQNILDLIIKIKSEDVNLEEQTIDFLLQVYGSRLDRLLNLIMRTVDERQLLKNGWLGQIITKLTPILILYYTRGVDHHVKTVHKLLPQLNNLTNQSNICYNRFVFQRLDEDSLKTHLHLKITLNQNSKNIISDTLIRFIYHLSDDRRQLQSVVKGFLNPVLDHYQKTHLDRMEQQDSLSVDDIQRLRMITKVIVEIFPNIHKSHKEELMRLKLYHYCMILHPSEPQLKQEERKEDQNMFVFLAKISNIITKHDTACSQELRDTLINRELMVKTIFVKLIVHKIKTFLAITTNYFQVLQRTPIPKMIKLPNGQDHKLQVQFLYEGYSSYIDTIVPCLQILMVNHPDNQLKTDTTGILINKLLTHHQYLFYQDEADSQECRELRDKLKAKVSDTLTSLLNGSCKKMFKWLMKNIQTYVHRLPLIVKKILSFQRYEPLFDPRFSAQTQSQLDYVKTVIEKVSENIDKSFYILEERHLNLGMRMNRKRQEVSIDVEEIDIKGEVNKLTNTCLIIAEVIIESNKHDLTQHGIHLIPQNYILSLLDFATLYLNKFQAEVHYPTQANHLIQATLWLIQNYFKYKEIKCNVKKLKRKEKKLEKKEIKNKEKQKKQKEKKRDIKKRKNQEKNRGIQQRKKEIFNCVQQFEEGSKKHIKQQLQEKEEKRPRKKPKKKKKKKRAVEKKEDEGSKTLQRNPSKTNLHQPKVHKQPTKTTKTPCKSHLHLTIEHYISLIVTTATQCQQPFMTNLTLQYLLRFISINQKKNYLSKPPYRNFQLLLNNYLPQLLKIQVSQKKTIAFHLVLSRLGLKQISEEHVKIDYQTGIKRYLFDCSDKKITLTQFLKFLQTNFRKPPSIPHLVELVHNNQQNVLTFTLDNLTGIVDTGKAKDFYVRPRNNLELNMVILKELSARKKSEEQKKEKAIKLSEYIPQGDINTFITILITHALEALIEEISRSIEYLSIKNTMSVEELQPVLAIEPFNLKVIIHTLQYLLRESPTLAPWIAKFKCKKIISNSLRHPNIKNKEATTQYIFSLINNSTEKGQAINQIGFLQVLLRLGSPFLLNTISGLIFQLCLDSTPLVLNKNNSNSSTNNSAEKQKDKQLQKYVSFGSIVRQKVISQFQTILFSGQSIQHVYRKTACLNMMTVLLNNRQMSRNLLEAGFIAKLHQEYSNAMNAHRSQLKTVNLPSPFLTKLYIPFLLQPLGLLQQLNIVFHHNKKLRTPKTVLNSLIMLSQQNINSQLIPNEVMKRQRFKHDWPYTKRPQRRREQRVNQDEQSDEDSMDQRSQGNSNEEIGSSEDDYMSNGSEQIEERMAELQRMEQESYLSIQSANQSQLLNDEWEYSNSQDMSMEEDDGMDEEYPRHDDRVIEDQLMRELQNDEQDQDDQGDSEDQSGELGDLMGQDLIDEDDSNDSGFDQLLEEGEQDSQDSGHPLRSHSHDPSLSHSSLSHYFSSESSQAQSNHLSPHQQLIIKHREEEQFYENVIDIISFEKINVVNKISKIEVMQVYQLRFFLQLHNRPQRMIEMAKEKCIKSSSETMEDKNVEENLILLEAFRRDRELQLVHLVEWNQIYRYDYFLKILPNSQSSLSKHFNDQFQLPSQRRRRNAIVRQTVTEIYPGGWQIRPQAQDDPQEDERARMTIRIVPGQRLHAQESSEQNESHSESDPFFNQDNNPQQNNQGQSLLDAEGDDQLSPLAIQEQPRRRHQIYSDQEIQQILINLQMNMTVDDFFLLHREIQNDIIQSYYLGEGQEGRREVANPPPNSPAERNGEVNELAQGRVREDQPIMSPLLVQMQPEVPILNQSRELIQPQQPNQSPLLEQYRKMSQQHLSRLTKDLLQSINKQGKNDSKFYQPSDAQLQEIFLLLHSLNDKEHRTFPYNLVQTLCLNTNNLKKVVSSAVTMLVCGADYQQEKRCTSEINQYEAHKLKECKLNPLLVVKVLHLLCHLSKTYSIAMQFLATNDSPSVNLQPWLRPYQTTQTSLQVLICLIPILSNYADPLPLKYLLELLQNITTHHFYKSIHTIITNTQPCNQSIQLSQQTTNKLANMLQQNIDSQHLITISRIIMRLSLNITNLEHFITFMQQLIHQLATLCLQSLNAMKNMSEQELKQYTTKDHLKIVNIMNIFYQMVSSFKNYPTDPQHHREVLLQLRKIVQIQQLQLLCQQSIQLLFSSNTNHQLQKSMGEVIEVFFILHQIAVVTMVDAVEQEINEDEEHKHIAELGDIKPVQIFSKSTELKREKEEVLLGEFNLSQLWRNSIAHPTFKTYINTCIKNKLSTKQAPNQTLLDLPLFKITISTPHMLTFDNKHLIFKQQIKRIKKQAKYHMIQLRLRRDEVFQDSFGQIMQQGAEVLKGRIKIEFKEEEGEDAGGITREWYQLLSRKMFDPNYCLFTPGSNGQSYHPSPQSYINKQHLQYFKFIGRITGKALFDGHLLDAYFTPAFYKHILNLPITYLDMEEQDYQYFNSLKWILENAPIQDYLELNFTHSFDNFGQSSTKELIKNGEKVLVTEDNKEQYVQLSSYAKMATSIKQQLEAFLLGFHDLIPHKLIRIFNQKELQIMISGRPTIDIEDLRRTTQLVNYQKHDEIIMWFFEVLEQFDMELRTAFLQFVTGSSKVPVEGFKELRGMNGVQRFNIHRQFQEERLPRAHTCFNQLDLPNYKSKQILIQKLMLAITEGKEGFHLL